MNQSNFQRSCPEHPEKQVIYACYNKFCNLHRLLCKNCMKLHSAHSNDLIDEQEIELKKQESSLKCQQSIKQLNKMFSEIQSQFKILISTLESEYIFAQQRLNTMENKQLNKYLNQLIIQSETEKKINKLFTNGFIYFQFQINKCLDYLQIVEQESDQKSQESWYIMNQYCQKDDQVNAIKVNDQALQSNKGNISSLYQKGHSLRLEGKYEKSIQMFDMALSIHPHYIKALWGKGDSLRMLSHYNEALKYLNSALQIDNFHASSLGSKGACLIEMERLDEAEKYLNQAIKLDPNNAVHHQQLSLQFQLFLEKLKEKRKI